MYVDPTGRGIIEIFKYILAAFLVIPMFFIKLFESGYFANFFEGLGRTGLAIAKFFENDPADRWFAYLSVGFELFIAGIVSLFKEGGWLAWLGSLFKKQPTGQKPPSYTLDQERTNTFSLQDKCFNYLVGDYTYSKWELHTSSKRKQLLEQLYANIQKTMSTSISGLRWESYGSSGDIRGGYAYQGGQPSNVMTLNEDLLSDAASSYELLRTVIHEVRHAFQQEAVLGLNNHVVCKNTINAWARNLPSNAKGYISGSPGYFDNTPPNRNIEKYVTQAIEWDAKCFSKQYFDLKYIDDYIWWATGQIVYVYYNPNNYPDRSYPGIWGIEPIER